MVSKRPKVSLIQLQPFSTFPRMTLLCPESSPSHSLSSTKSSSPPPLLISYVRFLLLDETGRSVLMEKVDNQHWDLPYVVLPWGLRNDALGACLELQKQLGFSDELVLFSGIAEMLGDVTCLYPRGKKEMAKIGTAKLLFVEPEPQNGWDGIDELPSQFSWKGLSFVSSIPHDDEYDPTTKDSFEIVTKILRGKSDTEKLLPHPPFQPGWFREAAAWLSSVIEGLGYTTTEYPVQMTLSASSSVLAVNSTDGEFYLKGVSAGSREVEITAAVTSMFPTLTPGYVCENKKLRAFVTRGFDVRSEDPDRIAIIKALTKIQKESVKHLSELSAAGVPSMRADELEDLIRWWCEDKTFIEASGGCFTMFKDMIPELVTMAYELANDRLPSCLLHGDLSSRNTGYTTLEDGSESLIFHDWEYAVTGHPFLEFHDSMDHWDEAISIYLDLWTDFESLERARESYEIAQVLGWLVKLRESFELIKKGDLIGRCPASSVLSYFRQVLIQLNSALTYWREQKHSAPKTFVCGLPTPQVRV